MNRILGLLLAVAVIAIALPALADEDVALHRPVTDSCLFDLTADSLCVDGDSLSSYESGRTAPVWVEVDLGADTPLKLVRLIPSMRPEGGMTVTVLGRTSLGVTYELATWTGAARHRTAISIPVYDRTPVRYLNVSVSSSVSRVGWFTIQGIKANGVTSATLDTWGRLKALYR